MNEESQKSKTERFVPIIYNWQVFMIREIITRR